MPTTRAQEARIKGHSDQTTLDSVSAGEKRKKAPAKSTPSKKAKKEGGKGGGEAEGPSGKEVRGNKDIGAENADTEYSEEVKAEAVEKRKATRKANIQREQDMDGSQKDVADGGPKVHDDIPAQEKVHDDPSLADNDTVVDSKARKEHLSSTILEKGIIYFFFRGRVNVDDPQSADDVARTFIVMRPLPLGAKIAGENGAPLPEGKNARLLMMPKKVLPKSHSDRFLVVVEKAGASIEELKENFVSGSEYETKTAGTRHKPPATPFGEGVYSITTTGKATHLAYILTAPDKPGPIQKELGLAERGSYLVTVKNPSQKGPPNARMGGKAAEFPKEIMDEFRGLRWIPLQPGLLDYAGAQSLFIGEDYGKLGKAVEVPPEAEGKNKETPLEELEQLEGEEEIRVHHLKNDDPIFEDLALSSKEHKGLQSSW